MDAGTAAGMPRQALLVQILKGIVAAVEQA